MNKSGGDIAKGANALIEWFKSQGIEPLEAIKYMGCATSFMVCEGFHGSERTEFVNDYVDCLWMAVRTDHSGRGH